MTDCVRRFLFEALDIRGALVSIGPTWHEMLAGRDDPPVVASLLGELVAATILIAGNLKTPGRITFQMQGHGLVPLLLADCDEQLRLRGTMRQNVGAGATHTYAELIGDGQLILTLQTNSGSPYQSIVPLAGDNLTQAFEHYLVQSEQQPAYLFLSADDSHVGGLFLQKLPGADNRDPDGWNRICHLAATLKSDELKQPVANLLMQLFPEEDIRLFDPRPVRYHCPRDEEKVLSVLRQLGRDEISDMLAEHGEISVDDDICRQNYRFGQDILARLFDDPASQ